MNWLWHARQKLLAHPAASQWAQACRPARPFAALALGGVDLQRSYRAWLAVALQLLESTPLNLVLMGGQNGRQAAQDLLAAFPPVLNERVLDQTARLSLAQGQALLVLALLAVCADGGPMHLACTVPVLIVALFHWHIDLAWRMPEDSGIASQRFPGGLSELPAQRIAQQCRALLAQDMAFRAFR